MRLAIGILGTIVVLAQLGEAQAKDGSALRSGPGEIIPVAEADRESYAVFGATRSQEAALRAQIRLMHPEVLPLRVLFVPHWKYIDNARIFHLHVPTGYSSVMFTHLPSRTVFIDNDRYMGEDWLGHWVAHELGHLAKNSPKEEDAEKAAREFRRCLRNSQRTCCEDFSPCIRGNNESTDSPRSLLLAASGSITPSLTPGAVCQQAQHGVQSEGSSLPATTGEALTITPIDMPDVDCVVQQWKGDAAKPVLTLLCPPGQVFAPLRVLIKLSWMKPEDAPVNPIDIHALPGAATKIRTCKTAALVWLQVRTKEGGQLQSTWVSFNGVVDVALLGGQSRKHSP